MKDRIKQIMDSKNMSQQEFANYVGLSASTLSGLFNERTKPTLNIVEQIMNNVPGVNVNWLLTGNGNMYMAEDGVATTSSPSSYAPPSPFDSDAPSSSSTVRYPTSAASTPAGDGNGTVDRMGNATNEARQQQPVLKIIDKPQRKITEIRVFFDDQTYESFVPKK